MGDSEVSRSCAHCGRELGYRPNQIRTLRFCTDNCRVYYHRKKQETNQLPVTI